MHFIFRRKRTKHDFEHGLICNHLVFNVVCAQIFMEENTYLVIAVVQKCNMNYTEKSFRDM